MVGISHRSRHRLDCLDVVGCQLSCQSMTDELSAIRIMGEKPVVFLVQPHDDARQQPFGGGWNRLHYRREMLLGEIHLA